MKCYDEKAFETTEAIEEAERICKDPNRKRFSSSKELREAFGI